MVQDYSSGRGPLRIQIQGQRELQRRLKKAGADLDELKAANLKAAQIVVPRAQSLAPKRTGKLVRTIRAGATRKAGVIRGGNNRKTGVPYAGVIHYGWPKHHIKAQPFMTTAAQQTENQWVKIYKFAVDKAIAQNL